MNDPQWIEASAEKLVGQFNAGEIESASHFLESNKHDMRRVMLTALGVVSMQLAGLKIDVSPFVVGINREILIGTTLGGAAILTTTIPVFRRWGRRVTAGHEGLLRIAREVYTDSLGELREVLSVAVEKNAINQLDSDSSGSVS